MKINIKLTAYSALALAYLLIFISLFYTDHISVDIYRLSYLTGFLSYSALVYYTLQHHSGNITEDKTQKKSLIL